MLKYVHLSLVLTWPDSIETGLSDFLLKTAEAGFSAFLTAFCLCPCICRRGSRRASFYVRSQSFQVTRYKIRQEAMAALQKAAVFPEGSVLK